MSLKTNRQAWLDILWLSAGAAMLVTAYFLVRVAMYLTVGGGFATASRDVVWMSPLGHLLFYLIVALPLLALATIVSAERAVRWSMMVIVGVSLFLVLLTHGELNIVARVALSVGLGVEFGRRLARRSPAVVRFARRSTWSLSVLLTVVALGIAGWRAVSFRRAIGRLPAPPAGAPNVLLVILDTVRADELSLYGYARQTTPELDEFAKGATVFDAAIATAPWTLPSHASLFTGRYPAWLNVDFRHRLKGKDPTLAEVLAGKGYLTFAMAANMSFVSWESGLARGFQEFHDYPINVEQVIRSSFYGASTLAERFFGRTQQVPKRVRLSRQFEVPPKPEHYLMDGDEVTDKFLTWHADRDTSRPYFAFLNYFDAHFPYSPPDSLARKFSNKPDGRALYDAELFAMDHEVGRLFAALKQSGELQNTIVIVASDHGEHLGERGLWRHGNSLYTPVVRVPLVVRYDGKVPAGKRVERPVSLRDVGKTIIDLTGVAPRSTFPGHTLAAAWNETQDSISVPVTMLMRTYEPNPFAPRNPSTMLAVFDSNLHLVTMSGTRRVEELFDYRKDSIETVNLVGSVEGMVAVPRLRALMRDALTADRTRGRRAGRAAAK